MLLKKSVAALAPSLAFVFTLSAGCTSPNPDAIIDGDRDLASVGTDDMGGDVDLAGMTGNEDQAGDPVARECKNLASAICSRLGKCSQYLMKYYYGDEATCVDRVQLTCAPYVNLRGSSWTPTRLKACADGYNSGTCDDYFAPGGPKACQPQAGTIADGAACAASDQCKSGYCNIGATSCGTCVAPAKAGEACSTAKPCGLGLTCASNKCYALAGVGEACSFTGASCKSGLYCTSGKCAAALGDGKTCDPFASGCDTLQGLFCNNTTRKCEAYKLAKAGSTCGTVMGAQVLCEAGGACITGGMSRQCVAAVRDGEACGPVNGGAQCMSPATCSNNACRVFDPTTCK